MSEKLEVPNIPVVGSMMQNLSITLDREQQTKVATWCMKMAFLADFTRRGGKQHRFYSRPEALAFAAGLTMPPNTHIWIGHMTTSHLITDGHDFTRNLQDLTRIGISTAVTIGVGHFVGQIVTDHLLPARTLPDPELEPRPGPWNRKLIQIWPIQRDWITWPPKASFTNGGPEGFLLCTSSTGGERVRRAIRSSNHQAAIPHSGRGWAEGRSPRSFRSSGSIFPSVSAFPS